MSPRSIEGAGRARGRFTPVSVVQAYIGGRTIVVAPVVPARVSMSSFRDTTPVEQSPPRLPWTS